MFLYLLLFLNIFCVVNQIIAVGDQRDSKLINDPLKAIAKIYKHRTFNGTRSYPFPSSLFNQNQGELKKDQVDAKIEQPIAEVVPAILEVPAIPVNKEIKPEKQTLNTDSAEKMTLRPSNKKQEPHVEKMTLRSNGKPSIVKYLSIKKNKNKRNKKTDKKCPYPECGGKKYGQQYFNTHLESHEGAFKCEYCEDFFASGIVLKRHKKVCCCR